MGKSGSPILTRTTFFPLIFSAFMICGAKAKAFSVPNNWAYMEKSFGCININFSRYEYNNYQ